MNLNDDLRLYQEQKAASRKKWLKYKEAHRVVQDGYNRFQAIQRLLISERTAEDQVFMKDYENYTHEDWQELTENADSKCQSALAQFTQVSLITSMRFCRK